MSMDAWEIREELKNRLERLLSEFLPGGSSDGHYYRTSGVHGGDGKSMVVHLTRGTKWERGDFYEGNEYLSEAKELLKDINDYLIGVC